MVKPITEHQWYTEYETEVLNGDKAVVLLFGASWCKACQTLKETININGINNVEILYLDVDKCESLADDHSVTSIPVVVIYEHGEVTNVFNNNVTTNDIIEAIREV